MKKYLFAVGVMLCLVSFRSSPDLSEAKVSQEQGFYVFSKSTPINEYETIGTVKCPPVVASKDFETILDILIKRVKKDYPDAKGLIVRDFEADAIKFK